MGHELAGHVVALGDGADNAWLGRMVAVKPDRVVLQLPLLPVRRAQPVPA
jgi:threonine dehydrogenase-like Zn-dependent dehydrogenase